MKFKEAIRRSMPIGAAEYLNNLKPELPKPKYKIKNKYIYSTGTNKHDKQIKVSRDKCNLTRLTRKFLLPDKPEII